MYVAIIVICEDETPFRSWVLAGPDQAAILDDRFMELRLDEEDNPSAVFLSVAAMTFKTKGAAESWIEEIREDYGAL